MKRFLVLFLILILSCGGKEDFSKLVYEVNPQSLSVDLSAYVNEVVNVKVSLLSDGLFRDSVRIYKAELIYIGYGGSEVRRSERRLDFVLNSGESKEISLVVISAGEKLTFPSAYVNLLLGRGECSTGEGGRRCRRDYEGEFGEDLASRTCEVRAGELRLFERNDGIFEGDGSGIREGRRVRVNFSQNVEEGAYVIARCMSLERARNFPHLVRINLHTDRGVEALEVRLSYRGG